MSKLTWQQKHQDTNAKLNDLNAKMLIAKRIVAACAEEVTRKIRLENINQRMFYYTKAEPYLIYKTKTLVERERKFCILDYDLDSKVTVRRYEDVRAALVDHYIEKRKIPNKALLANILRKDTNKSVGSKGGYDDVVSHIKNAGFTWVRLPGTNKSIIVEKPEQMFKRHRYLQQVMQYREDGRTFVYIEERNFNPNGLVNEYYNLNKQSPYLFMVATGTGFTDMIFLKLNSEDHLEKCIVTSVIPHIPQSSVIVLSEKNNHQKVSVLPNEHSTKDEMSKWLTMNNISHDPNGHKAELFTLIEKSKRKTEKGSYKIDEIAKVNGHDVIYRPLGIKMLNFFTKFLEDLVRYLNSKEMKNVQHKQSVLKSAVSFVRASYKNEDWKRIEQELIANEKKMYEEDMMMEVIIDQLMTMAKYSGIPETDLPSDLDSDLPDDQLLLDVIAI